ncbi:MAG: Coenzyme F420 hydrogenase/dehydrogenase, beta subunit C-terminal domain [Candidatus Bathyarchaeota archaeon]|nr:Coenzyme F420 hydrogenase/dehydrogenase, beta subunit C-terminal domain [Candidatus Bathyarchaeota archaeon]MDH5624187.1 Coenzyme F420 hydrogenase/dehydrogenase, beta subunit C-terminal domain [Candidatus Bathyarchaeota archaeon]MDH5636587.1 Coenzyme F420 hydrogenase/dehydrogenase, beta subunit C-terminal domain [Candidatus Bathyarchaeota archaeon]MDH5701437.1 Coenzyme F420 hydrogenase/dehydrogenase, beta subunit C-terminal domain [Candidatus Bathyarchaeota archaeon]
MEPKKPLSFGNLLAKVVLAEKCAGCAACVSVCPVSCLEYVEGKPKLVKKCANCGICVIVCPQYEYTQPSLEESIFGRQRKPEEEFGIYRRIVIAQAIDEKVLQSCQDGGVVTALLTYALEKEIIDGAAVSGLSQDKPFYPVPRLVTTPEEALECAGTRYTYSPNLLALQEGINQNKKRLAFVGTPCQIHALRKIEDLLLEYFNPLHLAIGLLCTESFTYEGLMEKHIQGELGVNLSDVEKINIKAKILVTTKSGEVKVIPLKEAKQYTRKSCTICTDFSAELADISVGGLGLSGWTFTILRTKKGEELFDNAVRKGFLKTRSVEEEKGAFDLLLRLSKRKRETAGSSL